jgi:trehalose 6-phosphate phosphatase
VGVVSGRPVAFLRRVLPVDGLELFGVYGMERWLDGGVVVDHRVEPFVAAVEGAAAAAEREIPGLLVERKGRVSCVLHWRTAPERAAEAIEVGRALATRFGLEASAGRKVLELRPPVPIDKGVAVAGLAEGMSAAMFAGDDVGDLAAFDALDRLVDAGGLGVAVTVAVASPEAPPDLLSRADEAVSGPPELVGLLATLADSIST